MSGRHRLDRATVITVLDEVTIIDDPTGATTYHYDLPAEGFRAGWAQAELLEHLRRGELLADAIRIDADPDITTILTGLLQPVVEEASPPELEANPIPRAELGWGRRRQAIQVAVAGAFLVAVGIAGAALLPETASETPLDVPAPITVSQTTTIPPPSPEPEPSPELEPDLPRHDFGVFTVFVPHAANFHVDGNTTIVTAADPDARYWFEIVPLEGQSPDEWWAARDRRVREDPTMTVTGPRHGIYTYTELPEDGSHAYWHAWIIGETAVSIACQTRLAPTPEQSHMCTDIVASVHAK